MHLSQTGKRRTWLRLLPVVLGLMLVVVACAPTAQAPLSTSTPVGAAPGTNTPAADTSAANATALPAGEQLKLQAGVDADGNFYRGDPNAPVKLVEFSDFQ